MYLVFIRKNKDDVQPSNKESGRLSERQYANDSVASQFSSQYSSNIANILKKEGRKKEYIEEF